MNHAVRQILKRTIDQYDLRRSWFPEEPEYSSRELAIDTLARLARIDYTYAAELIADKLAKRAERAHVRVCGQGPEQK